MKRKKYRRTRPNIASLKKTRKRMKNSAIARANSVYGGVPPGGVGVSPISVYLFNYVLKKRPREVSPESLTGRKTGLFCCILHSRRMQLRSQSPSCTKQQQKKNGVMLGMMFLEEIG